MADIFISYARADRETVEKLAAALEGEGYSLWWDRRIQSGSEFSKDIEAELDAAKAVVVCWSAAANESRWVKDEASAGAEAGKLMAVSLDGEHPPIGFRQFHCADLSAWRGRTDDAAFEDFNRAVRARITGEAPAAVNTALRAKKASTLNAAGLDLQKLLTTAIVFAGVAVIVWVSRPETRSPQPREETVSESAAVPVANARTPSAPMRENAIAVLPFAALSEDASDAWFGKGLAEELLNALAQIEDLDVAARTSAFSFEGSNADIAAIAERLGVSYVLEGSVRRSDDRLRITAQLIRASDGFQLWSETFERAQSDIFAIEDEIVRNIARALQVRLGVGAFRGLSRGENVDPRAYEAYLRGLSVWGERMRKDDARMIAEDAFKTAVELDPDFADAWSALGGVLVSSSGSPLSRNYPAYLQRTEDTLRRALALNPQSGEAHALMSVWLRREKQSIAMARRHLEKAQSLSPNSATTLAASAGLHAFIGDITQADAAFDRLLRADTLNVSAANGHAHFLAQTGRAEDAFAFFEDCFAENCMREGFLSFVMTYAVYTGDDALIEKWRPRYEGFEEFLTTIPPSMKPRVTEVLPAYFSIVLDRSDKEERINELIGIYKDDPVIGYLGMWGPVFADVLPEDIFFDAMESAADTGVFFSQIHSMDPYFGVNPYPEWVLRHPRYHAIWARPGMAELAEARRANGWDDGLPLPLASAAKGETD